ncbi:MAG: pyridoxal phosphate-dependent aminotransferase [Bacteroidaceae bacterium]|nr:pyridoxal phosphate-dependent aminotransferase [Bacteroidaceae bacterium]
MKYNFDEIIERKNTDCLKYDWAKDIFGSDDVIPMWIADMDFRTPQCIVDVMRKRMEHEIFGYTFLSPQWKPAIINWISRRYSWHVMEEEIGFVGGIVPAIAYIIQCFTNEGDKVLIQPPVYHPYNNVTRDFKRIPVNNPLRLVDGQYEIDFDDFEEKAKGCKLFLLCNPHNPGGRVWSAEELRRMAEICAENNVLVVSDEIHCDMTLYGYKHTPFAIVSDAAAQNSITLMAASKTFNIAGLKSSYHITPNANIRERYNEFLRINELDCAHLFASEAVAAAYNHGEEWLNQMLAYVEGNIDVMHDFIKKNMPKLDIIRPQASYLVFIDARGLQMPQEELVDFFAKKAKVGMNDGVMFGQEGRGFMRMNVGCPRSVLCKALTQIKTAYDDINKNDNSY